MRTTRPRRDCLLSIDPSSKGFGFAVFHGRDILVDWGVARVWGKTDEEFLVRVDGMIERYQPTLLVLEGEKSRRGEKMTRRLRMIVELATVRRLPVLHVPAESVSAVLGGAPMAKHDIAVAIAAMFPELAMHVPRRRTTWMGEDERTNLFDAVGLALAAMGAVQSHTGR